ncbi:C2 domain-containing protein 5 [Orchesella cincta]|uniref:C2 domain-containing protein 5 n=1 Tax=Orchesella cincta TaxID=48709 RepID=A0A1D2NEZ2_ORCCI|nr:C2 domain-containing protein 5 [Orchesella cincta]
MPGKVKVKIVSGRNLPIMDRSNLTTDAYVEVKLGSSIYKTDVYRKSLHPVWNSEWFRFEMDDLELQDEPLQIRLMDHDTYSSNDAIGKVYLDLNPLLCNSSRGKDTSGKMISGWIPVYDTMHGIRGEVNLIVKVELFSDLNKFRQSSCGVRFFFTQSVPEGYIAHTMKGFVEELVVNDDPEYQWIDKIRTPRASNEARQTLFSKLSGEVQRKVGLKALELGGNAVIGYKQCFDLEGESGIVVRGIGTAAYLTRQYESQLSPTCGETLGMSREFAELQGYRSLSKNGRSLRKRGGPGRAPRLQRRSFRVPSSSDSMSGTLLLHQHIDGGTGRKKSHDDTCLMAHAASNFDEVESLVEPGGGAIVKHGSFEGFKERSSSFREDSIMKLMKSNLKKSLTSSTHSVPPTSSSPAKKQPFVTNVPGVPQNYLSVATSEPCIEVSSSQPHEGNRLCPSYTTTISNPLPYMYSKPISFIPAAAFRSRSSSRSPHNVSPRCKPHRIECSSIIENDADSALNSPHSSRRDNTPFVTNHSFEDANSPSKSALASCIMHVRANSETMSSDVSSHTIGSEHDRSKSVTELTNSTVAIGSSHVPIYLGSVGDIESAGSNIDSNPEGEIDEDSTSDTSMRILYGIRATHAMRRPFDIDFESDTSKDFTKASSGNEACSVDNDELSPVSERDGFLLLRKKRGSRRKDRYSKSSLMKRASANFAERGLLLGGTDKLKEEVVKFFKRKKSSDDNESCSSGTKNALSSNRKFLKTKSSPYRDVKFFFRRRRTNSNSVKNVPNPLGSSGRSKSSSLLFRSNSESHSLGQTSLDSMPSIGSEPAFDPDEDDSTHEVLNAGIYLADKDKGACSTVPKLNLPELDKVSGKEPSVAVPDPDSFHQVAASNTENVLQLTKSKIIEIVKELGYSTDSPLKLYISSMDALLVYDPSEESSNVGTLVSECGGAGASACSLSSSASSTIIFHVNSESNALNKMLGGGGSSSSAQSCSTSKSSLFTPSARSRYLARQETVKLRPTVSQLFESDASGMNSFSTSSSKSRIETNESFSTSTSESVGNVSTLNKLMTKYKGHVPLKKTGSMRDNTKCSCISQSQFGAMSSFRSRQNMEQLPNCSVHAQSENKVSFSVYADRCDSVDKVGDMLHPESSLEIEDVLVVTAVSELSSRRGEDNVDDDEVVENKKDVKICDLHDNFEHMGVTGCRSPIPEELLCDRSTPTQSNLNQPNSLTGGVSNFSVSTITNSIAQHAPTSATVNAVNFYNNPPSETSTFMNANNNTTSNLTNNNNGRTMVCGGKHNHSLSRGANSSDDSSMVARQDNGNSAAATLDETATKTSLVSKSPCPPYPSSADPQKNHTKNGLSHHRQGSRDKNSVAQTAQDTAIDIETKLDEHSHTTSKNGVAPTYNKVAPKIPISTAFYSQHGVRNQATASSFSGHGHSNITTTIITSATGTVPLSHTSSICAHMRSFPPGMKPGITAVDQYGLMEYPFITISQFPPGFLTHIGGTVTARSVKLLERISNLEEPESRDAWWNEIRMEIRAHCRAFGCTVVVGYEEHTTMCDDVCVLSASGTAAIATTTIGLKSMELLAVSTKLGAPSAVIADAPCHGRGFGMEKDRSVLTKLDSALNATNNGSIKHILVTTTPSKLRHDSDSDPNCSILHIPTNPVILPFPVKMSRCHVCRKGRVPDVLIVTVDVPPGLHITGKGTLIQAQVFRPKKDCKGEISAKEVSDSLPFLEYELHRRLINKLKVKGMNAIFGLKVQICLGDKLMVAVATGTAMYVTALPPPGVPIITAGNLKTDAQKVLQYQKVVQEAYDRNRQHYDLKSVSSPANGRHSGSSDGEDSDDDENSDIQCGTKDTYILEVDDAEDIDIISMLIDPHPTLGFLMNNIDYLHGYEEHHVTSQQMFTQVWRCRIPTLSLRQFTAYFERLIRAVSFKLRKMMPCVLTNLSFRVELPEPDEMQIAIIGLALGMVDPVKMAAAEKAANLKAGSILAVAKDEGELIFPLEEDGSSSNNSAQGSLPRTRPVDASGSGSDGVTRDVPRITPPPLGVLVSAVGQTNNFAAARHCAISSSPLSHGCGHLGTNCCGHANGSGGLHCTGLAVSRLSHRTKVFLKTLCFSVQASIFPYLDQFNYKAFQSK